LIQTQFKEEQEANLIEYVEEEYIEDNNDEDTDDGFENENVNIKFESEDDKNKSSTEGVPEALSMTCELCPKVFGN
jgi:hypothetical protein